MLLNILLCAHMELKFLTKIKQAHVLTWPVNVCALVGRLSFEPLHLPQQVLERDAVEVLQHDGGDDGPGGDGHVVNLLQRHLVPEPLDQRLLLECQARDVPATQHTPGPVFIKHLKSNVYVTLNAIGSFQCNLCSHWLIQIFITLVSYEYWPRGLNNVIDRQIVFRIWKHYIITIHTQTHETRYIIHKVYDMHPSPRITHTKKTLISIVVLVLVA